MTEGHQGPHRCVFSVVVQEFVSVSVWSKTNGVGKGVFIKHNMPRGDDLVCGEVETPVSFVVSWIAKEDTFGGLGGKFV
jgi:hypothetical protein